MNPRQYLPPRQPIGSCTLLADIRWDRAEAPAMHGRVNRTDLPSSRYPLGVICTGRNVTTEECKRFDLAPLIRDAWTGL